LDLGVWPKGKYLSKWLHCVLSKSTGWAQYVDLPCLVRSGKPHPYRLGTTLPSLSHLKFYLLPFSKGIIVHPLKLVAVKEKVLFLVCLDEAVAAI